MNMHMHAHTMAGRPQVTGQFVIVLQMFVIGTVIFNYTQIYTCLYNYTYIEN